MPKHNACIHMIVMFRLTTLNRSFHEGKNDFQIEINLFNMQFFYVLVLIYDYDYDFVCLLFINRRSYVGW